MSHICPTSPEATTSPPQTRLDWIDTARGIAIILVVFGHCWRGLAQAGLLTHPWLVTAVDDFIYMFHMNAFFMLAGHFLARRVQTAPLASFLRTQVIRLLYPLALWTYVFLALRVLAGGASNTRVGLGDLLVAPLPPVDHMWFLWALFNGTLLLALIIKALPGQVGRPGFWFALSLLGHGLWVWVEIPPVLVPWVIETLRHTPVLALGVALGLTPRWMSGDRPLMVSSLLAFVALGAMAGLFQEKSLSLALASLVMTLVFLQIAQGVARMRSLRVIDGVLRSLGQRTMAIFLAHTIFSAATRIALIKLGVNDPMLHVIFGVATGLIGPYLLHDLAVRWRLSRLLGF